MTVIFDIQHLYYLPQYLPVIEQLQSRGVKVKFVCYQIADETLARIVEKAVENVDV